MPKHRWRGTELQFERPDGDWGEAVDLKGEPGRDGIGGIVQTSSGSTASGNSYFPSGW